MAHAAEHVMEQRPSESKQDQSPEETAEKSGDKGERRRIRGRGDKPPGEQQRTQIKACPCNAMCNRHRHGQGEAIDLQMGGERTRRVAVRLASVRGHHGEPSRSVDFLASTK